MGISIRLSAMDLQRAEAMIKSPFMARNPRYKIELETIMSSGNKCELEALHSISLDLLFDFLENVILQGDYI